jgi:multidrug/hemolysin transport system permease protein
MKIKTSDMLLFAKRNILTFFRDKTSVFFSFLSALIIIMLYVLFLGDMLVNQFHSFGQDARFIVNSWIMAGVISVTSITSAMGAFDPMVNDKSNKILKDFYAAPVKRRDIAAGYIIGAYVTGVIMTAVALVFGEIYIVAYGGKLLPFAGYIKILGVILISVLVNASMMFFIVSFIRSAAAFATVNTIVGTLIGFLTGVYLPIGQLPDEIGTVVKIIPTSHSAVLLRQIMMNDTLLQAAGGNEQALAQFKSDMGINFSAFGTTLTPVQHILYLSIAAALFIALSVIRISGKEKS